MTSEPVRLRVRVEGIVQGVGFRPFCHLLATRLALAGFVTNDEQGVLAEVEGPPDAVDAFVAAMSKQPPPLAVVEAVTTQRLPVASAVGFTIAPSDRHGVRRTMVSPDMATCDECLRELWDPGDRRYRYPFVNCTHCGPRFTIVRDVPYDRPFTTMAGFAMCPDCAAEYADPADRRFHAQPLCCPACGPALRLVDATGEALPGDPLAETVRLLRAGAVVAVKGLGGYHLAALASDEPAVGALRARKHREDKPFAVMVADLAATRILCEVGDAEAALLTSARRPIVLLPRRAAAAVAPSVAPGTRELGLVLPYTPLHHLLAADLAAPFVLTSGNVSDEPIAHVDDDARHRLAGIADAFLTHDRAIHVRTDDSVLRVWRGAPLPLRRSRGFAPEPLRLALDVSRPVLACGAELKSTFCLARGRHAFVSHHIGDLENAETLRAFTEGVAHFRRLFDIAPEVVAHDLHPDYLSTSYAESLTGVDLLGVQHHHAHVASCLADNGETGPVIGVAFDGLGYGLDGTLWGGEFLLADLAGFTRLGHLDVVPMPGGAAAIREPWRMAAAHADHAYAGAPPDGLAVAARHAERWPAIVQLCRSRLNAPLTSSAGRLFDAVAALVGLRDAVTFEGQAAIALEQAADGAVSVGYPVTVTDGEPFVVRTGEVVRAVVDDVTAGAGAGLVAGRFHATMATVVLAGCRAARERTGVTTVALSGGVWQNVLLLSRAADLLAGDGFRVLTHHRVPPNDGGISLGQAAVAAVAPTAAGAP